MARCQSPGHQLLRDRLAAGSADLAMLADGGYTVWGADESPAPAALPHIEIRRRGAGTAVAANA